MKNLFIIIVTLLLISCGSQKAKEITQQQKDISVVEENNIEPSDSSFMDFFEKFMWDKEFQKSRVIFPCKQDNKNSTTSETWEHLPFYTKSEYIPILSSDTVTPFEKDVNVADIKLFILNLAKRTTTSYNFKKDENKWFLRSSENLSIKNAPDFEFIDFLTTFSNDSVFQINHIAFPLPETYLDSDKDYETIEKTIQLKDWKHIKVVDSVNKLMVLSDIDKKSKYRNIFYRGVENGIWVKYTFEKIKGQWKFIKSEDFST